MSKVDLKVVLLGKEYCGKTSLVERFLYDTFRGQNPYQNTIGAAFGAKKFEVAGNVITIGLWDTAGSERYESISRIYYRGAHAAIICYDLSDSTSFERAKFWVTEIKDKESDCRLYLCGTKNDLVASDRKLRKVDYHNTTDYAEEIHAEVFETSSKTGKGVYELFFKIAEDYLNTKVKEPENGIALHQLCVEERRPGCC